MNQQNDISGFVWADKGLSDAHRYLVPALLSELQFDRPSRIFELGFGNGSVANVLSKSGWNVSGVDPSVQGVAVASRAYPHLHLIKGSAYDDLASIFGRFPIVLSMEVIEHVYSPRVYVSCLFDLLEPGGRAIISTPYHGYLKNLALAVTGKMDAHFTALWDHGHIKFWSIATLSALLAEAGFVNVRFRRVGRVPPFAKSMIAVAYKS
jgi:2-polyprenyl-3-methyl-5-hydroxy-6-metoxy-1,4-benzoquinol methylase